MFGCQAADQYARLLCRTHIAATCGGQEGASCPANLYSPWGGLLLHGSPADGALPAATKLQPAHVLSAQCNSHAHARIASRIGTEISVVLKHVCNSVTDPAWQDTRVL